MGRSSRWERRHQSCYPWQFQGRSQGMWAKRQHRRRRRSAPRFISDLGGGQGKGKAATYHVETLVGVLLCSRTTDAVDTGPLSVIDSSLADPLNRSLEVFMECARDGTADIVSQIPGSDEQDVDAGDLGNLLYLYIISIRSSSLLQPLPDQLTFSNASFVSICTIVSRASLAPWRYSTPETPPIEPMANGLPKPLRPTGGNLADSTNLRASSAVYKRGTTIP